MKIIRLIDETRKRWRIELQECRDALLSPKKAKPNPLDRMVVEFDYLLVEARRAIADFQATLEQYADVANWGYYDASGCSKGHGRYTDACFIGPEPAKETLERA